jgi:hypothetical protein
VLAILTKGLSPDVLRNPRRVHNFAAGVASHLTVDRQLTSEVLRKTALSLRLTSSDLRPLQAPISGFGTSSTKQSIDLVDAEQLRELSLALRNDTMSDYLARYPGG